MKRRSFLVGSVLVATSATAFSTACKKEERCKNCGMKIDPTSGWNADLIGMDDKPVRFDTPRCAFTYWRSGKMQAKDLRATDYYERAIRDSAELKFVVGGDVLGPMGPDLVPVDAKRAPKFIQDHSADKAYAASEVTMQVLNDIK